MIKYNNIIWIKWPTTTMSVRRLFSRGGQKYTICLKNGQTILFSPLALPCGRPWLQQSLTLFQRSLFLRITHFFLDLSQLYYWRTNTLVQLFIWKHNVYKQMRHSIIGKENAWEARGGGERVVLIKSLIYSRKK